MYEKDNKTSVSGISDVRHVVFFPFYSRVREPISSMQ